MRLTTTMLTLLAVPALLAAQTPQIPNANASLALQHRARHMRGSVVGLDNRPVTPATPAIPAKPATPASGDGPATSAVPARPAVPASPSHNPSSPGQSGGHRP